MTPAAAGVRRRTDANVVPVLIVVALGALIAVLRLPRAALGTVWAEDGTVFLQDSILGSPAQHLFAPYEGYLQFAPRLLADLATVFGIPNAGDALTLEVCIVTGAIAGVVYLCAGSIVHNRWLRASLALLTVLTPTVPIEILGTGANLHSLFLWATPWLLLTLPTRRIGAWLLALVMLIGALSEIQTLLFLPLILVHLRSRLSWPIRGAFLVGLGAQIVATILAPRAAQNATSAPSALSVGKNFITQVLLPIYAPRGDVLDFFIDHALILWGILAAIPLVFALVVVLLHGQRIQKIASITLAAAAVILWTLDVSLNHFGSGPPPPAAFIFTRYGVIPAMFLLAVVVIAVQVLITTQRGGRRVVPSAILAGILVAVVIAGFVPTENLRSNGPSWRASIAAATRSCATTAPSTVLRVGVAPDPDTGPGGWAINIRCASLK